MFIKPDEFIARLAQHALAPVYVLTGDEPLQMKLCLDAIRERCRSDGLDERVVFDAGINLDWGAVEAELSSPSLFASRRLIEIRLHDKTLGIDGAKRVSRLCDDADRPDVVIITMGKLDKRTQQTAWVKAVDRIGVIVQIWPINGPMLIRWVMQRGKTKGLTLSQEAVEMIASSVEGNLLAAEQELDILSLSFPERNIGSREVSASLVENSRYDVFALVDAALSGDSGRTVRILSNLRTAGVEPILINWALTRELRQLCLQASHGQQGSTHQVYIPAARQKLLNTTLQRHTQASLRGLLLKAGRVDRAIKGISESLPWTDLADILVGLARGPHGTQSRSHQPGM